jgi:hypothetical protein
LELWGHLFLQITVPPLREKRIHEDATWQRWAQDILQAAKAHKFIEAPSEDSPRENRKGLEYAIRHCGPFKVLPYR